MQRRLRSQLSVRVWPLPSSRQEPLALTPAGRVHCHSAWTLDLGDSPIHEQAPFALLKLRAAPGLPPPATWTTTLIPHSMASFSGYSFGSLLDPRRRPFPSALPRLSPSEFHPVSAHLLRPLSPPSFSAALTRLTLNRTYILHRMALFQ